MNDPAEPPWRYCDVCDQALFDAAAYCPTCGARLPARPPLTPRALATVLPELHRLHGEGVIDTGCYTALRDRFEEQIRAIQAARMQPEPAAAVPAVPVPPPVEPPPSLGQRLAEWTAARQADILLYLGAFLLSVAALIFVGYQGEALRGPARFTILVLYTLAFLGAGLLLPRWERVREAAVVFLALGAILVPINFIALRTQVLGHGRVPDDAVWLIGGAVTAALYLALALRGYGRLYALPGAVAAVIAWGALASVLQLPSEWFGPWFAGGAAAVYGAAIAARRPAHRWIGLGVVLIDGGALLFAHAAALGASSEGHNTAQLPVTYLLVTVAAVVAADRGPARLPKLALLPLAAGLGASTLWAAGVPPSWWAYPGLATVAAGLLAEPWWRARPNLRAAGWPYALAASVLMPLAFVGVYRHHPAHGITAFTIAAGLILVVAWRARGNIATVAGYGGSPRTLTWERVALAWLAGAYIYGAAAYANLLSGWVGADRAWLYAALGTAAWIGLALTAARIPRAMTGLFGVLMPVAVAGLAVAAALAAGAPGRAALIHVLAAAGATGAFPSTRRWSLWAIAAVFVSFAVGYAWGWRALDPAGLPLTYAVLAGGLWASLARLRRYEPDERGAVIVALSWAGWAVAGSVAVAVLVRRAGALGPDEALVRTREWAVLAGIVGLSATAVLAEGLRLRRGGVAVAGTVGLLAAALLVIAITEPSNVQAYTAPAGLYFVALGLGYRRSPAVAGEQMSLHEAVTIAGMLLMTLPAAEQSFAPGGSRYGLELIGEGLAFLTIGFVLSARWLVAGGVLTLTGVAIRWLWLYSARAPYWLTLGIVGSALIGVGLLLLLQRDRWDRIRERIARWWQRPPLGPSYP